MKGETGELGKRMQATLEGTLSRPKYKPIIISNKFASIIPAHHTALATALINELEKRFNGDSGFYSDREVDVMIDELTKNNKELLNIINNLKAEIGQIEQSRKFENKSISTSTKLVYVAITVVTGYAAVLSYLYFTKN
jgi:hypothetical protein